MSKLTITLNYLNFSVKSEDDRIIRSIDYVCSKLTSYTYTFNKHTKRVHKQPDKAYYVYDPIENVYRYPITLLKPFMATLGHNGIKREDIEVINNKNDNTNAIIKFTPNEKYELRDYQREAIDIFMRDIKKRIMLLDLFTGAGKSLVSSRFVYEYQKRVAFILLPKYIKKWIADLKEYINVEDEDIYVVQGDDSLIELMEEEDISYKVIIFSIPTITNYLKNYETREVNYPVQPYELMNHLGVGAIINDETHNFFHALTRAICYFDAEICICSSATLDSNQKEVRALYQNVIPEENRITNLTKQEPYVYMMPIEYRLEFNKNIKFKRNQGYNHILYEQSLIKNGIALKSYFEMVLYYIETRFFKKRCPEDKAAIFFASVDMCNLFTNYIKKKYPNENIYRYIGGDDYHTMLNSNIIITNHSMLGTGIDIKNLTFVLQTVSASSLQANVQNFGRLRKIEGKEVWYYYIYTNDIKNQYRMHRDRFEAVKRKCKDIFFVEYPKLIRTR